MPPRIEYYKFMPWIQRGAGPTVVAAADGDRLRRGLASAGFRVLPLDDSIRTEEGFHEAIAGVLDLPAYYGKNWDAFDECIADWAQVDEQAAALVWSGWETWLGADVPGFIRTIAMLATAVSRLERQLEIFMVGPIRLDEEVTHR